MIHRIIEFSVRNRFLVLLIVSGVSLWGVYCVYRTPVDAIPDLSENQVIVWADWPGRSPKEIEDQITYPLSVNLQGLAGVKSIRATSEFGFSMLNIIFDERTEYYFARERVLERLSVAGSFLPQGVVPYLAPDATALGQIFWYTVEGASRSLEELRTIQDWYVRYQLNAVAGVAQVASAGGFVREYQVDVDPGKLRAYNVSLGQVFQAVASSNSSVGGNVIHQGGAEYLIRGHGWLRGIEDLEQVVVVERQGVPIRVLDLGVVQVGPAFRRSVLEKEGREAVGGVVMMRYGENPLEVTRRIKEKIRELEPGLPAGVRVVPFYDRTGLIEASIATLTGSLVEAIAVASLVVFLVLWHLRSAFVICVTLPLAVLISFIFMYYFAIPSNIMSLAGIAISIGVLVDAGIVMTENAYNRLHEHFTHERDTGGRVVGDTRELVLEACKVVGGPLFFSVLIMILSFAPVFVLGGIEGKMFNPLAYTKTFALVGVAVLAITLLPALIPTFVRGRLRSQDEVWLVRSFVEIYRPLLAFFLRHPDVIVVITGLVLLVGLPVFPQKVPWIFFVAGAPFLLGCTVAFAAKHKLACFAILLCGAAAAFQTIRPLGEEFMPPLDELSLMDMPTTTPNVNITQAAGDLLRRGQVLRQFPEVHQVVGKAGRADTPTDPAPIDMVETIITFRPKAWWPRRKVPIELAESEARTVAAAIERLGLLAAGKGADHGFSNALAMEGTLRTDRVLRELSLRRLHEHVPEKAGRLLARLREQVVARLRARGALRDAIPEASWVAFDAQAVARHAAELDEWILIEDVQQAVDEVLDHLERSHGLQRRPGLLIDEPGALAIVRETAAAFTGRHPRTFVERLRDELETENDRLVRERVRRLNWELEDRAPGALAWCTIEAAVELARRDKALVREPGSEELHSLRGERERALAGRLELWPKLKSDVQQEMDTELQVPGWGNIWTQPIINRVDMLSTGVRTMIGVKVFGPELDGLQRVSNEIAGILRPIPGAVDVLPDQIVGENYLEISIDRERAARYGVSVQAIQEVIEVALGGKDITMTVEGRARFPVRVRYPRDLRVDEDSVRNLLVAAQTTGEAGGASGAMSSAPATGMAAAPMPAAPPAGGASPSAEQPAPRLRQVPLSVVADIRLQPGPSMIKSENGLLRSYVQLNVRGRDIVGFVEEAKQAVAAFALPPGYSIEWSGQFEHQMRAQKTLTIVFPLVILIIFVVLYLTYRDLADTTFMFLAVPGAVAGGALAQLIAHHLGGAGFNFSVAVWVGYIVCFGLATETSIVMLVYLREAIEKRGGLANIASLEGIKEAVMEGAVHRLRPKLLTEGTTVLALIPMLWATGVGSEFIQPMAVPILGGILVADEVVDILIPVLFYLERCRRWRKLRGGEEVPVTA